MEQYWWVLCILMLVFVLYSEKKQKKYAALQNIKNRKKGRDNKIMLELLKKFMGKDCIIQTLTNQYVGIIKEVTDGGVLIENEGQSEIVNIDYIIHAKEYPVNKKGKRKAFC